MRPAAVPTPAVPEPETFANEAGDSARPILLRSERARGGTTFRDRGHTPECSRPRESSRGHPQPANTLTPALPFSFAPQRLCSDFTGTACRASLPDSKNRRNTCPKISSSASNATANEKIRPPTTAMNVIAICMMPSLELLHLSLSSPLTATHVAGSKGQASVFAPLSCVWTYTLWRKAHAKHLRSDSRSGLN